MSIIFEQSPPRGFLVGVEQTRNPGELTVEDSLLELGLLADTGGIHVVGQATQRVAHPDPATYIRSGKVEEVSYWVEELDVDVVIFDDELSPRHQRELEKAFNEDVRVIDRTVLILDIFAQHAHTREGALQIELAQYEYRLPRLTRQWTHLARQAGGSTTRGSAGGVGLRGPGETQLETDRREIGRKIAQLKADLEDVRAHRARHRTRRRKSGIPVVSLVGYTNAGKSTLLNRLANTDVYVADQLFATLDPTTRRVSLPNGREVLFTDTVGFIQKLPHTLIAAFQATLEEIAEADAILHLVDAMHPNTKQHINVVRNTLKEDLGITEIPALLVLNKIDDVNEEYSDRLPRLLDTYPDAIPISALYGKNVKGLLEVVEDMVASTGYRISVRIPYSDGAAIANFHELAFVESEQSQETCIEMVGIVDKQYLSKFDDYIVENLHDRR